MTKRDFLSELSKNLKRLPQSEINKSTDFYSELIDDKVEDGMGEAEAVESLGNTADIAKKIIDDSQFRTLNATAESGKIFYSSTPPSEVVYQRKTSTWLIVLLSVTAIFWVPLAFALIAVIWAVLFALLACVFAVAISGIAFVVLSPFAFIQMGGSGGLMVIGGGLVLIGLGILGSLAMVYLIKFIIFLTKKIFHSSKKGFNKGENNK